MLQVSDYKGDASHNIACHGDCVVGDEICFERATFSGSYPNASFAGFERIVAKVIKDSYGKDKQQHTFTLALPTGAMIRIKGRNLYKEGVWRKAWSDETARQAARDEKHKRGDEARAIRAETKANPLY